MLTEIEDNLTYKERATKDKFTGYINESKQKIFISKNGSIFPNKYAGKKELNRPTSDGL